MRHGPVTSDPVLGWDTTDRPGWRQAMRRGSVTSNPVLGWDTTDRLGWRQAMRRGPVTSNAAFAARTGGGEAGRR